MTKQHVTGRPLSRRDFLKAGCLTGVAAGVTLCGAGLARPDPDPTPIDPPAFAYGEENMERKLLVAYASAYGSTVEVAAEIGQTLAAAGWQVDVRPVGEVHALDGYQAVLIGSAVQFGRWLPEALAFVQAQQAALSQLPVALFCVHIHNLGNDAKSRRGRLAYLDELRPLVNLRSEAFFAGRFDRRGAAQMLPAWVARFIPDDRPARQDRNPQLGEECPGAVCLSGGLDGPRPPQPIKRFQKQNLRRTKWKSQSKIMTWAARRWRSTGAACTNWVAQPPWRSC